MSVKKSDRERPDFLRQILLHLHYSIPHMLIAAEAISGIMIMLISVEVTNVVAESAVSPLKRVLIATTEAAGDIAMEIIGARKA